LPTNSWMTNFILKLQSKDHFSKMVRMEKSKTL
jgi:hypothetical protein